MTRKRFENLMRAITVQIGKEVGFHVDGKTFRYQREIIAKNYRERFGSYQAAWDSLKGVRETFKFQ